MAGDIDYMLRAITALDDFHKHLIAATSLRNVSSRFSMERVKSTTMLPLGMAGQAAGP